MSKFARVLLSVTAVAALLVVGNPISVWAGSTPEIDPSSGTAALALLAGAVLVIRGRFKK